MPTNQPKKLKIEIDLSNDIFVAEPETEISRLLFELAHTVNCSGLADHRLQHLNGNTVGSFTVTRAPPS